MQQFIERREDAGRPRSASTAAQSIRACWRLAMQRGVGEKSRRHEASVNDVIECVLQQNGGYIKHNFK